jgi:flagellar basal body rod protein FlgB
MRKILVILTLCLWATSAPAQDLERFFYSDYYFSVEEGMRIGSQKQAIYSYIIANASTPGVDLVNLLPADDRIKLKSRLPDDATKQKEVVIEFVLSQMIENNKKLMALTTIWGNKAKSLKNVVTLGK